MDQRDEMTETHPGVIGSLLRYPRMAVAIVLGVVVVSIVAGLVVAPRAQASATIALATPPPESVVASGITGDASMARYTAQRASFVTSDAVLGAVAEELGHDDITGLRRDISASPSQTANTIVVTAEASSREAATDLADAVIDAYRTESQNEVARLTDAVVASIEESAQEIRDGVAGDDGDVAAASAANTLSELEIQASEIRSTSALFGDGVEFVIAPRVDAVAVPGFPVREAALGFVLGLVIAGTAAWMRADRELTASARVGSVLDPEPRFVPTAEAAGDPDAEAAGGLGAYAAGDDTDARAPDEDEEVHDDRVVVRVTDREAGAASDLEGERVTVGVSEGEGEGGDAGSDPESDERLRGPKWKT